MRRSRCFSLLEIMVGISLAMMAAGAIGWKIHGTVVKKRFKGDLELFKSRVLSTHTLAFNMQADWTGILQLDGKTWTFEVSCLDPPKAKPFAPISLHVSDVLLDGKKQESCQFYFFASGEVWPSGVLEFCSEHHKQTEKIEIPLILGKTNGDGTKKLGPVHPSECSD